MSREGPIDLTIPEQHFKSCRGCIYFETHGVVYGHNFRENETRCLHPIVKNEDSLPGFGVWSQGKIIQHRTREYEYRTPDWCPLLKKE